MFFCQRMGYANRMIPFIDPTLDGFIVTVGADSMNEALPGVMAQSGEICPLRVLDGGKRFDFLNRFSF